jgi:hypothetical protein
MHTTPELVALVQRERERSIEHDRLSRIAACAEACCAPSLVDRIVRALPAGAERVLAGLR